MSVKVDMPIARKLGAIPVIGTGMSLARVILVVCAVVCTFFAVVGFALGMGGQSVRDFGRRASSFANRQFTLAGKEAVPFLSYYFYSNDKTAAEKAKVEAAEAWQSIWEDESEVKKSEGESFKPGTIKMPADMNLNAESTAGSGSAGVEDLVQLGSSLVDDEVLFSEDEEEEDVSFTAGRPGAAEPKNAGFDSTL